MPIERSLADFVFQTLTSCGNKEIVDRNAPINPTTVMMPNVLSTPTGLEGLYVLGIASSIFQF